MKTNSKFKVRDKAIPVMAVHTDLLQKSDLATVASIFNDIEGNYYYQIKGKKFITYKNILIPENQLCSLDEANVLSAKKKKDMNAWLAGDPFGCKATRAAMLKRKG